MTEEEHLEAQEFGRQQNALWTIRKSTDLLVPEELAELANLSVSFENCHIFANMLYNANPLVARALRNELNIYIKGS